MPAGAAESNNNNKVHEELALHFRQSSRRFGRRWRRRDSMTTMGQLARLAPQSSKEAAAAEADEQQAR